MGQTQSWSGCWQRVVESEASGPVEFHKLRVGSDPERVTFELHRGQWHCLLCGDLCEEWQPAPPDASVFVALYAEGAAGLEAPLSWRHFWADGSKVLRTEISSEAAGVKTVLRIDRQLAFGGRMTIKSQLQKGESGDAITQLSAPFQRSAEGAGEGPSPVAFLRAHGQPLKSLEDRLKALDKVEELLAECDIISKAQAADRVVPPEWGGLALMIRGGIAYYKGLLPEWTTPEPVADLNPPPIKAGVEADYAVHNEPKGVCINIAPWNAPATLSLGPAVSMLAAGNHVVIKPAELVPTVSAALRRLCQKYLSGYVWVEEGGKEVVERLIDEGADHLEFTGGGETAKVVAARCAKTLTPLTLELGGKSPAFVDAGLSSDMLRNIAKEITETKVFKSGQFCCAHDYALVHKSVFSEFCAVFEEVVKGLGDKRHVPLIGQKQYASMKFLLNDANAQCIPAMEGDFQPNDKEMSVPMTGLLSPSFDREVLKREIFGPIIPILSVSGVEEAIDIINRIGPKPLIAYCYTKEEGSENAFVKSVPAGNIAVNGGPQRMIGNYAVSFGGTGPSGTGAGFWGKDALREFSNRKYVMSAKDGFARSFFSGLPP
ncbi:unnamed protein product [Durusdinium trenchii]|uniref:Aldehyde dehydrogenase domain-containing protein n=1 Tax=Durusdinium trenchii TaxID=1381693 RepID=A0ABP0HCU6_9DINO